MNKRNIFKVLVIAFLTLFLITTVYLIKFTTFFKQKAYEPTTNNLSIQTAGQLADSIKILNSSIIGFSQNYKDIKNPNDLLQKRMIDAEKRKTEMSELIEKDPRKFLELAVPEKVIINYDPVIKNSFEKEVSIEGTLENTILDNFDRKESKNELYFKSGDQRYKLFSLDRKIEEKPTGSILSIKGYLLDSKLAILSYDEKNPARKDLELSNTIAPDKDVISEIDPTLTTLSPTFTPAPQINKKIAVVLFNFENKKEEPWSVSDINKWTFTNSNSINAYFQEASFSKLKFTGDVFGWLTVPITIQPGSCPSYEGSAKAKEILLNQGTNLDSYDYIMYAFPYMNCWASAWAYILGKESWINGSFNIYNNPSASGGSVANTNVGIPIHELGHNLGTHHANAYDCKDVGGTRVSVDMPSRCQSLEYADMFDVMGYDYFYSRQFSSFHKGQIGWLTTSNKKQVSTVGRYNIYPMEKNLANRTQSLRIPANIDPNSGRQLYYYLEYRKPFGIFDNYNITDSVVNGVSVRLASDYTDHYDRTNLIDTTASTYDTKDSALGLNKIFDDKIRGIKIKTVVANSNYATIEYSKYKPVCVRSKPTVSLYPVSGWGKPGEWLSYSVNITNNDSFSCGASTFTIEPTLFSGWKQTPENPTVSILPATTSYLMISVQSSNNSTAGYYTFTEKIRYPAGDQFSSSVLANYNVYYSDITPPVINFIYPQNNQTVTGWQKIILDIKDDTQVGWAWIYYDDYNYVCDKWYDCYFDFTRLSADTHILKVIASDVLYNSSEAQINFIVQNLPPQTSTPFATVSPSSFPTPTGTVLPPTSSPTPKPSNSPRPTIPPKQLDL